jgi:hypothetical protein
MKDRMNKRTAKVLLLLLLLQASGCSQKMDIYEICKKGDVEALAKLLDADPALLNCQEVTAKWTPLNQSIDSRQYKVTEYLIAKGANVNLKTIYDGTALQDAAFNIDVKTVRLLLDAGAEVNAQDSTPSRATPLDYALLRGEHLMRDIKYPSKPKKHFVPKTPAELRAEEEALQKIIEMLKERGAKRGSELVGDVRQL